MKKTFKKSGVGSIDPKIDYLAFYREAPDYLKQKSSLQDLARRVQESREEKARREL
jgi:hypothetical protein